MHGSTRPSPTERPDLPAFRRPRVYPGQTMFCPFCRYPDSRVIDSRTSDDGLAIRRRRQCPQCGRRFSTTETASLSVIKRSGIVELFSREKIISGVRKACQGRPVSDADLALLAQKVEESIRATGVSQIEANDIGLSILLPLRELDEVAYLRFASVYQGFDSLDDFEAAITLLRVEHSTAQADAAVTSDGVTGADA
jgi:transcriptional repressor NrdR